MKALIQYCEPKYEKTDLLYEFYNSISNILDYIHFVS